MSVDLNYFLLEIGLAATRVVQGVRPCIRKRNLTEDVSDIGGGCRVDRCQGRERSSRRQNLGTSSRRATYGTGQADRKRKNSVSHSGCGYRGAERGEASVFSLFF